MQDIDTAEAVDEQRIFVVGPDPLATNLALFLKTFIANWQGEWL